MTAVVPLQTIKTSFFDPPLRPQMALGLQTELGYENLLIASFINRLSNKIRITSKARETTMIVMACHRGSSKKGRNCSRSDHFDFIKYEASPSSEAASITPSKTPQTTPAFIRTNGRDSHLSMTTEGTCLCDRINASWLGIKFGVGVLQNTSMYFALRAMLRMF
jgi:hypothetical protein